MQQTDLATRVVASTDNSIYQVLPAAVATPASAAEVSALIAANHRSAHPLPVVARGGGTGTNGQGLTDGLVVDLKQSMREIHSIDAEAQIAVVDPGVVTATLNRRLEPFGLHWAPHTSTIDRATVGGMIATDAAGKGSLVHGRTHRHVAALDLCLADGTIVHLAPTPSADVRRRAEGEGPDARLWRELLAIAHRVRGADTITPALAREWTGYGVDRLVADDVIDPLQLVVGAEGTLGVVTKAWLRLTPLPTSTATIVAVYGSFDDALGASLELRETAPTAIETFDETTLRAARSSTAWPAIGRIVGEAVGEADGAVLVLEYDDQPNHGDGLDGVLDTVRSDGRCRGAAVADAADRASVWRVRADAVGLLARQVVRDVAADGTARLARPTAMVEDCAVPVREMPSFIASFRALLDDAGLSYGMFGHADVGCVHVRPALDVAHPDHERLVGELTERVVDLVTRHGGVLWGEHGRGMRGASVERVLTAEQVDLMRAVKSAFDPDDRCNPGKLYRPLTSDEPLTTVVDAPMRGRLDRAVPVGVRTEHHSAFACNGNGLCHVTESAAPMCPSYQATGDPALSPKGRADLIRAWLRQRACGGTDARFEQAIADNLHECLSCAACSGRCPVEVDVPELKSRFLDAYHSDRRRPLADHVLSRFERLAPFAARAPAVARLATRMTERLLGLTDLPTPPRPTTVVHRRFDANAANTGRSDVVVLADVFTSVLEPETIDATVQALADSGHRVSVAPLLPSGKFDHVVGRRAAFRRAARRQRALVESVVAAGAEPVVIEPAIALLHAHEYPEILGLDTADPTAGLTADLASVLEPLPPGTATGHHTRVTLLGHCTDRARRPDETSRWVSVLSASGYDVEFVATGCCGMAGVFGHQRSNQPMSHDLWERNWAPAVKAALADGRDVVATGWSCRSQADRHGIEIHHPIHLLSDVPGCAQLGCST